VSLLFETILHRFTHLLLDGGGVRGLSSLYILKYVMYEVMAREDLSKLPKPCDYFDMIAGTSTGG
jgi:patatin-like phospholipase/acyl hydrolase